MIALTVKITGNKIATTMGLIDPAKQRTALEAIGDGLVARASANIRGRTGPDGSWPSSVRAESSWSSGRIWNRITQSLQKDVRGDDTVAVGSSDPLGAVLQLGTTGAGGTMPDIVPVKKKALTIPIDIAAEKASLAGIDARTAFPDAFVLKPQHGASPLNVGVLVRKIGGRTNKTTGQKENQKLQILYVLVSRVAIRPHSFLPIDTQGNISPASLSDDIATAIRGAYMGSK